MTTIRESIAEIKMPVPVRYDEPLSPRTSFRIGGPADALASPSSAAQAGAVLAACRGAGVPVFLLGGGTNLLVADAGIRGLVVDLTGLRGVRVDGDEFSYDEDTVLRMKEVEGEFHHTDRNRLRRA